MEFNAPHPARIAVIIFRSNEDEDTWVDSVDHCQQSYEKEDWVDAQTNSLSNITDVVDGVATLIINYLILVGEQSLISRYDWIFINVITIITLQMKCYRNEVNEEEAEDGSIEIHNVR